MKHYKIQKYTSPDRKMQINEYETWPVMTAFLARDSMLSTIYAIARPYVRLSVCLSVCLSVRHTGGSVENG